MRLKLNPIRKLAIIADYRNLSVLNIVGTDDKIPRVIFLNRVGNGLFFGSRFNIKFFRNGFFDNDTIFPHRLNHLSINAATDEFDKAFVAQEL